MNYYRIKRELERRNISIRSICKNIGVTEQGLHQMIRNGSMKISVLEEISRALKVDIMFWFQEENRHTAIAETETTYGTESEKLENIGIQIAQLLSSIIKERQVEK